jgi:Ser/Thr protein kinase RdoA (MazF antagonist)
MPPEAALAAWQLDAARVRPLGTGLINRTFLVTAGDGTRHVLQELNPVFQPEVNEDIQAICARLRARGLLAPQLVPTARGQLWTLVDGRAWRLQTHIPGRSLERLGSPDEAREAGRLLAAFHRALGDFDHGFRQQRRGVHDTPRHLASLETALARHATHPAIDQVRPLAQGILELARHLPTVPSAPERIVHGDPKINNLLFDPDAVRAICWIDLDTVSRMPLALELGDAFRSWCNPKGEDDRLAGFSLDLFSAAVTAYAEGTRGWLEPAERDGIVAGTLTIYVELAARFCADALNESYFGWNPQRFASRSEHNEVRAESQLNAARELWSLRPLADEAVRRAFGGG